MNEQTAAKVSEILDKFAAGKQAETAARETAKSRTANFRRDFLRLQETIIVPAMQAIGDMVRNRGYGFEIDTAREGADLRMPDLRTKLFVSVGRIGDRRHKPSMEVICDTSQEVIRFEGHIPTRGSFLAKLGAVSPAEIDQDFVHTKAIEFLGIVFDGKPL